MRFFILTLALCLGVCIQTLDISIANVAVPSIAGGLGVSTSEGTWIITSFAAAQAVVLPMTGWLVRSFSEHRLFATSTALFGLTSALCGLSTDLTMLVFSRIAQGAVSGVLMPLSQSLLIQLWPADKRKLVLGMWAMIALLGPSLGPILGGFISETWDWPWVFFINVPICIFCSVCILCLWSGAETTRTRLTPDWFGLALLVIAVACLQTCLDKGNEWDFWHNYTFRSLSILSAISFVYLFIWEKHTKNSLLELELFKIRSFTVGCLIGIAGTIAFFGPFTIFPIWLQKFIGYTPTWAGLVIAPIGILPMIISPFTGKLTDRFGTGTVLAVGFAVLAITFFWGANFTTNTSAAVFAVNRFIAGLGIALFFSPLVTYSIKDIISTKVSSAVGIFSFVRYMVGLGAGTSILVTIFDRHTRYHRERIVSQIIPSREAVDSALDSLALILTEPQQGLAILDKSGTQQAATMALNDIFWLCGWMSLTMIPVSLMLPLLKPEVQPATSTAD